MSDGRVAVCLLSVFHHHQSGLNYRYIVSDHYRIIMPSTWHEVYNLRSSNDVMGNSDDCMENDD